jgi:hypothetical protein
MARKKALQVLESQEALKALLEAQCVQCTYTHTHAHTHTCTHTCTYLYIHMCNILDSPMHTHTHICKYTDILTHVPCQIYTCTHIYMHTHLSAAIEGFEFSKGPVLSMGPWSSLQDMVIGP